MAVATPAATRSTVELALAGKRSDVSGRIFSALLLLCLLVSLGVLLVLLGSVLVDAWPVLSERGFGFVTGNLSDFESRAGVWQGLIGSLILIAFVAVIAVPLGVARRDLPAGVRPRHEGDPVADHEHPQPRRSAVDRLGDPRGGRLRAAPPGHHGP